MDWRGIGLAQKSGEGSSQHWHDRGLRCSSDDGAARCLMLRRERALRTVYKPTDAALIRRTARKTRTLPRRKLDTRNSGRPSHRMRRNRKLERCRNFTPPLRPRQRSASPIVRGDDATVAADAPRATRWCDHTRGGSRARQREAGNRARQPAGRRAKTRARRPPGAGPTRTGGRGRPAAPDATAARPQGQAEPPRGRDGDARNPRDTTRAGRATARAVSILPCRGAPRQARHPRMTGRAVADEGFGGGRMMSPFHAMIGS